MKMQTLNSKLGFTLIEVVIAVTLMSFLSLFTAISINQAIRDKQKVQERMDQTANVQDVMNFMVRDIELAFNYRDIDIELYNLAIKTASGTSGASTSGTSATTTATAGQTGSSSSGTGSNQAYQPKQDIIVTQFIGEQDRIDFSSLSNIRTVPDASESAQAEISYFVKACNRGGTCLWRRSSPYIDDDITEGGTETPILPNVRSLQFRYLGPGYEEEWARSWRSDGKGTQSMAGNFPYAVEITLEIEPEENSKQKQMKVSRVARIRFTNNKEDNVEKSNSLEQ